MKNLKIICGLFLLLFAPNLWAQSNGHVTLLKKNATMVYLGGGITTPSSDAKDVGFGNLTNINLELYQSLWQRNNASFGLHAFGEYGFGNGEIKNLTAFPIAGYTSSVENSAVPKLTGISVGVGPQMNFGLGDKAMISPILDFAYVDQKLDAYSINQTYTSGGTSKSFSLYSQPEIKSSGLGIIPRLRFQYFFSKNIGIWLEGNYSLLPKINTTSSTFSPNGNPIQNGQYNIDQILTGTQNPKEVAINNSGIGFGGGVVILFGKTNSDDIRKGWDGKGKANTADIKKGWNGKTKILNNEKSETETQENKSVSDNSNSVYRRQHWWNHWTGVNCGGSGIYCRSPLKTIDDNLDLNETIGKTEIALNKRDITIITIGEKGNISEEILNKFLSEDVKLFDNELPRDIALKLFKKINLNLPIEKIILKAKDQKYQVIDGIDRNKIIEAEEKTTIIIDKIKYNLKIITSSGKADTKSNQSFTTRLKSIQ